LPHNDIVKLVQAVQYLVGAPKGRPGRLERDLAGKPWRDARSDGQVKLLPMDGELYVFAQSLDQVAEERAMRRRQLKGPVGAAESPASDARPPEPGRVDLEGRPGHPADPSSGAVAHRGPHFLAFLADCLQVTLGRRLKALALGLTPRSVFEKFAAVQMIDVRIPTADGGELQPTRYTQPEPELMLLL
jgi:hypothetical protein